MASLAPRSIATGSLVGTLPWVVGYAITYLLVAPNLRDSALNRIIETLDGAPATHELVGWVFYNAHFVDVVLDIPILGSQTTAYIGGDTGFTPALYLVPVVPLIAAGTLVSRQQAATDPATGGLAGLSVVPGYLVLTMIGGLLFEITVGGPPAARISRPQSSSLASSIRLFVLGLVASGGPSSKTNGNRLRTRRSGLIASVTRSDSLLSRFDCRRRLSGCRPSFRRQWCRRRHHRTLRRRRVPSLTWRPDG